MSQSAAISETEPQRPAEPPPPGTSEVPELAQARERAPVLEPSRHPPKPALVIRAGIVGHRWDRLEPDARASLPARIKELLSLIQNAACDFQKNSPGLFASVPARLRAVSSMAEGTDRMGANAALELGGEVHCILPFPREMFEDDFRQAGSREEFRRILSRAAATLELDGTREAEDAAYAAASKVIVSQSDILIAVWDGRPDRGEGGTLGAMRQALSHNVCVLWVAPETSRACRVLTRESDLALAPGVPVETDIAARVRALARDLLAPPGNGETQSAQVLDPSEHPRLSDYFKERLPSLVWGFVWDALCRTVGGGSSRECDRRCDRPDCLSADGQVPEDWGSAAPPQLKMANRKLLPYFLWADYLAVAYSCRYRSLFAFNYIMSTVAVFAALLSLILAEHVAAVGLCIAGELLIITAIIALTLFGRRQRWHERWIDYRILAERIRQLRTLAPISGIRIFGHWPDYLGAYVNPNETWMAWYARNLEREIGVPDLRLNEALLKDYVRYASEVILGSERGEIAYFHRVHERFERMEKRLHAVGNFLFVSTWVLCCLHFMPHVLGMSLPAWFASEYLTICAALFPALGAAIFAIRNQAELQRTAKRARAMSQKLKLIQAQLNQLAGQPAPLTARNVREPLAQMAQLLVDEASEWRVVFTDRPLNLPA